jgi:hypothetical protein
MLFSVKTVFGSLASCAKAPASDNICSGKHHVIVRESPQIIIIITRIIIKGSGRSASLPGCFTSKERALVPTR